MNPGGKNSEEPIDGPEGAPDPPPAKPGSTDAFFATLFDDDASSDDTPDIEAFFQPRIAPPTDLFEDPRSLQPPPPAGKGKYPAKAPPSPPGLRASPSKLPSMNQAAKAKSGGGECSNRKTWFAVSIYKFDEKKTETCAEGITINLTTGLGEAERLNNPKEKRVKIDDIEPGGTGAVLKMSHDTDVYEAIGDFYAEPGDAK